MSHESGSNLCPLKSQNSWIWSSYCTQPLEGLVSIMSEMQPLFAANAFILGRRTVGRLVAPPLNLWVLGEVLLAEPSVEASLLPTRASQTDDRASQQQHQR